MFTVVASTRRPCGAGTTMVCGVAAGFGSRAMDRVSEGRAAEALVVAVADRRARTGFGTPGSAALRVVRLTVPLPDSSLISIPSLLAAGRAGRADRIRPPAPAYSGGPNSGSGSRYSAGVRDHYWGLSDGRSRRLSVREGSRPAPAKWGLSDGGRTESVGRRASRRSWARAHPRRGRPRGSRARRCRRTHWSRDRGAAAIPGQESHGQLRWGS